MASFTVNTLSTTQQTLMDGESGFIGIDGTLVVNNDDAIIGLGGNDLTVLGTVTTTGTSSTAHVYEFNSSIARIMIGPNGHLHSVTGSAIDGRAEININILNHGTISSGLDSLDLSH